MQASPLDNRGQLQHVLLSFSPPRLPAAKRMMVLLNSSTLRCGGEQKAEMLADRRNSIRQLNERSESQKNLKRVYININTGCYQMSMSPAAMYFLSTIFNQSPVSLNLRWFAQ